MMMSMKAKYGGEVNTNCYTFADAIHLMLMYYSMMNYVLTKVENENANKRIVCKFLRLNLFFCKEICHL